MGQLQLHTTSTFSGVLLVAIGTLLLLFDGAADSLALDPRIAVRVESAATALAAHAPDAAVLVAVAAVVGLTVRYQLRRSPVNPRADDGEPEAVPSDGSSGVSTRSSIDEDG